MAAETSALTDIVQYPWPKELSDLETGQELAREALSLEDSDVDERPNRRLGRFYRQKCLPLSIASVLVILAPVNLVSAILAKDSEDWKPVFVGIFSLWMAMLAVGFYIDLSHLPGTQFTKRALIHMGSSILMLYLFVSATNLTADMLPQWAPLIIDCGLGVSIGVQSLNTKTRKRIWTQFNEFVGNLCGGVQIRFEGARV